MTRDYAVCGLSLFFNFVIWPAVRGFSNRPSRGLKRKFFASAIAMGSELLPLENGREAVVWRRILVPSIGEDAELAAALPYTAARPLPLVWPQHEALNRELPELALVVALAACAPAAQVRNGGLDRRPGEEPRADGEEALERYFGRALIRLRGRDSGRMQPKFR